MATKRNNPIIEKIELTQDQQKKLEDYLALENQNHKIKFHHVISSLTRRRHIISIVGKLCSFCYGIPSYQVSYPCGGISRVERFCQSCYDKRQERDRLAKESKSYIETDPERINEVYMKERSTLQNY